MVSGCECHFAACLSLLSFRNLVQDPFDSILKDHVSGMHNCFDLADAVQTKGNHLEQREKLGLTSATKQQSTARTPLHEPTEALQKVEVGIWLVVLVIRQISS